MVEADKDGEWFEKGMTMPHGSSKELRHVGKTEAHTQAHIQYSPANRRGNSIKLMNDRRRAHEVMGWTPSGSEIDR